MVLNEFYRSELKSEVSKFIEKWEEKIGVKLQGYEVKKMKTKWGSCNIEAKKILLNLELAKVPLECIEYILVHEMIHLKERLHNDNFKALMDRYLPNWIEIKNVLNSQISDYPTITT